MRILIVKLGAIGDVIRTTSILPGLNKKYPGATIDWLTASNAKDVLLHNAFINRIFVWDARDELKNYDLVIGLEDDFDACKLVSRINAQQIRGAYIKDGKITYTPSAWFDMSAISKYGLEEANKLKKRNRKTFQQHMADLLEIEIGHYIFKLTPEEIEYGRKYVKGLGLSQGEKVVGINTGAGKRWQLKALSVEKTIELINRIKKDLGIASIILGGEDEKERNAMIAKETGMPEGGVHALRHFAAVINQCYSMVSSDSLAMHLAIALGKKLVVFFGPTSATEIELYGLGAKVTSKMDCLSCYRKTCDKQPNCMDELSVDELFQAVKRCSI
jgi:heptosyltransferase-2